MDRDDRTNSPERKLAAIMSADVVGYSRLMELDEAETLTRLSNLRNAIDALIAQRGGRVAGSEGDSVLAEFPSVVEAAACAIEVQQAVMALNETYENDARMLLRIGLNVGDVIAKDETVFGDGVNVAARLQALAPPGGICISQLARDHLQNRENYEFVDLGMLSLKNISRPVQAFKLVPGQLIGRSNVADISDSISGAEIAFWEGINTSENRDDYLAYLEKYPQGHFSAVAKTRLAELDEGALSKEDALKVELLFWESVKDSEDPALLQAYLDKFPDGQFIELANVAIQRTGDG